MNDADLTWGGDLQSSPTGDILLASDSNLGRQRVLRRLLTNSDDYVWNPHYGAGLGEFVGTVTDARLIVGTMRTQLFDEAAVARLPQPAVDVDIIGNGAVYVDLRYVDSASLTTQYLAFTVNG